MRTLQKIIIRKNFKNSYGKKPEDSRYIVHTIYNYGNRIHSYESVSNCSVERLLYQARLLQKEVDMW